MTVVPITSLIRTTVLPISLHDSHAHNASYRHDCRADKRHYRHDRNMNYNIAFSGLVFPLLD